MSNIFENRTLEQVEGTLEVNKMENDFNESILVPEGMIFNNVINQILSDVVGSSGITEHHVKGHASGCFSKGGGGHTKACFSKSQ